MSSNTSQKVGYECGECGFMADTRPGLKRHITVVHPAPAPDANLAHALMRKLSQSAGCPVTSCRFRAGDRNEMEAHVARHVAEGCVPPVPKKKTVPSNLQRVRYVIFPFVIPIPNKSFIVNLQLVISDMIEKNIDVKCVPMRAPLKRPSTST